MRFRLVYHAETLDSPEKRSPHRLSLRLGLLKARACSFSPVGRPVRQARPARGRRPAAAPARCGNHRDEKRSETLDVGKARQGGAAHLFGAFPTAAQGILAGIPDLQRRGGGAGRCATPPTNLLPSSSVSERFYAQAGRCQRTRSRSAADWPAGCMRHCAVAHLMPRCAAPPLPFSSKTPPFCAVLSRRLSHLRHRLSFLSFQLKEDLQLKSSSSLQRHRLV